MREIGPQVEKSSCSKKNTFKYTTPPRRLGFADVCAADSDEHARIGIVSKVWKKARHELETRYEEETGTRQIVKFRRKHSMLM